MRSQRTRPSVPSLPAKRVLESDREKFEPFHLPGTMRSAGPVKPGDAASRHASSPLTRPSYLASAAESDARANQVGALPFRAYISSIKLRRLIRNAPNFQTRIKLQQLQDTPGIQLRKEKAGNKTNTTAGRRPQSERAERTSSRGMAISNRPQGHSHRPGQKPMNVLIVSAVFPPEPVVTAQTSFQIADELFHHGHQVTVLAPFPNRPDGRLFKGYRQVTLPQGEHGFLGDPLLLLSLQEVHHGQPVAGEYWALPLPVPSASSSCLGRMFST